MAGFDPGLSAVTGMAAHFIEFVCPLLFIGPEILSIDLDGHAHHFACGCFHGVFVGGIVQAVGLIVQPHMAKITGYSQGLVVRFHDAVERFIVDVLRQNLQIAFWQWIGRCE